MCKLDRVTNPKMNCRYRYRRNARLGRSRCFPRVVSPLALRPIRPKRANRLIFARLAGRKVPLLHCHAGSLATLRCSGYGYKHALIHVSHVLKHDSSVLVVHKIGMFPARVRSIVLRVPRFRPRCLLVVSHGGGASAVRLGIRIHRSTCSSRVGGVLTLGGGLASHLRDILKLKMSIGLIRPHDVRHDMNGTGEIVSGEGLWIMAFWVSGVVMTGRLSVFLRGGSNHLARIARILTGRGVGLSTLYVTRGTSFNVLHNVMSSPSETCGTLGRGRFTIGMASIMNVDYPGMPNTLTGMLQFLSSRKMFVRCVCSFTGGGATGIIVHPGSVRGYVHMLARGGMSLLTTDSLCEL